MKLEANDSVECSLMRIADYLYELVELAKPPKPIEYVNMIRAFQYTNKIDRDIDITDWANREKAVNIEALSDDGHCATVKFIVPKK